MPATIRQGSTGDTVKQWQGIIGVTSDGKFGPNTTAATKAWQSGHQLAPDGVVGPQTWAVALAQPGEPVKAPPVTSPTPQANTDAAAYRVAVSAKLPLTEKEVQYALAVARGEGFYGKGWGHPSQRTQEDSKKFGLTGFEGKNSNNWGAEQGTGNAGSFPHVDYHADGKAYVGQYRKHATPEDGFRSFAKVLYSGGKRKDEGAAAIRKAIAASDLHQAVLEQHANGYFELNPEKYFEAVQRNYDTLTANIGWPKLLAAGAASVGGSGSIGIVVGLALALTGGLLYWKLRT